jgi:deferrochelatase/peroxidase EfeB
MYALEAWPYVEGSDEGLFFSAFSRDPNILLSSLCSMAGLTGGGVDRLLQFTTGVQCGIYFVPSKTQLAKLF